MSNFIIQGIVAACSISIIHTSIIIHRREVSEEVEGSLPSLQDLENQLIRPNGDRRRWHRPEKMRRQPAVQRDHALLLQDQSRALEDPCVLLSAVGHRGLTQSGADNLFLI